MWHKHKSKTLTKYIYLICVHTTAIILIMSSSSWFYYPELLLLLCELDLIKFQGGTQLIPL